MRGLGSLYVLWDFSRIRFLSISLPIAFLMM